jgi:short-subunit dehydrogenase
MECMSDRDHGGGLAAGSVRVAFITGASSGIGRALALEYAGRGFDVVAAARRLPLLEELAAEARGTGLAGAIHPVVLDVSQPDAIVAALLAADSRFGRLDTVIANAGIGRQGLAHAQPAAQIDALVAVNVLGVFRTIDAALPAMLRRGSGRVAAVASLAGLTPIPGAAHYAASKAAVVSYCRAVRAELAGRGPTMTCVCPGFVETPLIRDTDGKAMVWAPERAARVIADGIERGRAQVAFPWAMAALLRVAGLLPWWLTELVWRRVPVLRRLVSADRARLEAGETTPLAP